MSLTARLLFIFLAAALLFRPVAFGQEQAAPQAKGQKTDSEAKEKRPRVYDISNEKIKEFEDGVAKFRGNPTREDFAKLEEFSSIFRTAPAPTSDGQTWLDWYYEMLQAPDKRDADSWKHHFENFDRWIAAFPESPIPPTAKARGHIVHGWEERGSGFANTVSEARWAIFHDQLERASELLEKARKLKGHDADVYYQLIQVGKATGADWKAVMAHLDAGRKLDPYYYPLYEETAVFLLPRWQGNPGDIGKFAETVLKDMPGDDGLEIYARVAAQVNQYDHTLLLEREFDIDKVRAGAKILQARYRDSHFFQNFAGLVGWRTQDLEMAKSAEAAVRKNPIAREWGNPRSLSQFFRFCRQSIAPPKHSRTVWSLQNEPLVTAISPSGNSLVIGLRTEVKGSPAICIKSLGNLSTIQEFSGTGYGVHDIAIDPSGKKVAISYYRGPGGQPPSVLELYDVGDWQHPRLLHDDRVKSFGATSFSPNG